MDVDALRGQAFEIGEGRSAVPEPIVKQLLATLGVAVPAGATAATPRDLAGAADGLGSPLVLKAHGPGLVHKSDVGAVQLGIDLGSLETAARDMVERLDVAGLHPTGLLVEEQQPAGVEVIVGVVNRPDVGPVVVLGIGGTLTELIGETSVRLCPLDEERAWELVDTFPGVALLDGVRGQDPVDKGALVSLLLAVAGPDGLVDQVGPALAEFECNPVIVTAKGAVAVDGRLILRGVEAAPDHSLPPPAEWSFDELFLPRSVAVVGASTSKLTFGNRFLRSYRALGWSDGLYAIHPSADQIEGVEARPSVADIPGGVDYLVVAVPAASCAAVVRGAAGHVRFAQVMSGGFREASTDGAALEADLLRAGRESAVRIVGPNCMGVYSPAGRQTFQLGDPTDSGPVSIASQSGGLAGDIIKAGAQRGVRFSKLATIGNSIDVTPGELVEYFVDDPDTGVIGLYLEGTADGGRLVDALRRARGTKPAVLLVGGLSGEGSRAAASHTGSMTGDTKVWQAISEETGATVVRTLEELVSVLVYFQRYRDWIGPDDPGALIVGPGGGASILAADAADRHGLALTPVATESQAALRAKGYGAGTSVANPIEIPIGPGVGPDAFDPVVGTVLDGQPYSDVVLHVNVHSFYSHGDRGLAPLVEMLEDLTAQGWPTRLGLALRNLDCATPDDVATVQQAAQRLGLPYFRDFDQAMVAVRAAKRFTHARARGEGPGSVDSPGPQS